MSRLLLPKLALSTLALTWGSTMVYADFLPPNDLYLQDSVNFTKGISEQEFNAVLDEIQDVFGPVIQNFGGELVINRNWDDSTVNASANQMGSTWELNMYGGLARRPEITKDGFTMVVCHELNHHLGGFPFVSSWAADEGQSDYGAFIGCSRKLWANRDEDNQQAQNNISEYPKQLCDKKYSGNAARNLCYREMLAGESLAGLLAALENGSISYTTPDKSVVKKTYHGHPKAQCRLDTYVAAILCTAQWDFNVIPKNETESANYTCTKKDGFTVGLRPLCWFKPTL